VLLERAEMMSERFHSKFSPVKHKERMGHKEEDFHAA
jgi:hypothetical protein